MLKSGFTPQSIFYVLFVFLLTAFLGIYSSSSFSGYKEMQKQVVQNKLKEEMYNAPVGMVSFFKGKNACPPGWTPFDDGRGRLILGITDPTLVNTTDGEALADGKFPGVHRHDFTVYGKLFGKSSSLFDHSGGSLSKHGEYQATLPSSDEDLGYPFVQLQGCKNTTEGKGDDFPFSSIAFFTTKTCPSKWTLFEPANGRFILIAPSLDTISEQTEILWRDNKVLFHQHKYTGSGNAGSETHSAGSGAETALSGTTHINFSRVSGHAGHAIPLIRLLACQKTIFPEKRPSKSDGVALPEDIGVFYNGRLCPQGWDITSDFFGRFVISGGMDSPNQEALLGSKDPMKPKEFERTHTHTGSGTVTLGDHRALDLSSHCCRSFGKFEFDIQASLNEAADGDNFILPFITYNFCAKSDS